MFKGYSRDFGYFARARNDWVALLEKSGSGKLTDLLAFSRDVD